MDAEHCSECGGRTYGGIEIKAHKHDVGSSHASAGQCCYSGPQDCDNERRYCSKDAGRCAECGGTFYSNKDLEVLNHDTGSSHSAIAHATVHVNVTHDLPKEPSLAQPEMLLAVPPSESSATSLAAQLDGGKCCYTGVDDCDSERDSCSKDAAHCEACDGTYYNSTELENLKQKAKSDKADHSASELAATPLMLASMPAAEESEPGQCCYSGVGDCDSQHDWCSKGKARCTLCNGVYYNASELAAAPSVPLQPVESSASSPEREQQNTNGSEDPEISLASA